MDHGFPFSIHRYSHDSRNIPQPHYHDFIELVYVERGGGRHLFQGERYELRAGDVFIVNPGESHTFQVHEAERLDIINCLFQPHLIHASILRELEMSESMDYFYIHPFLNPRERFNHLLNLRDADADRVLMTFESMIEESGARQVGYQTLIRLRMIELLVLLSRYYGIARGYGRPSTTDNRRTVAQRICGYLERHYQQRTTLASLAMLFNTSTRQLNRIFHDEIGVSVVEKIHQIRLEKAKTLLADTDEKIIVIAAMVGYEDPAFFTRLFTREVWCAPGRFRAHASEAKR